MTNETVNQVCIEMETESEDYGLSAYEIGLYIDRIGAAHDREIAAKDATIADMLNDIKQLMTSGGKACVLYTKYEKELSMKNILIKELADKLTDLLACDGVYRDGADCYKKCPEASREMCGRGKTCQLVAKAREAVK